MSDKEFKVVTREETFNDLAVRELAKGRAACICRLQFGKCKQEECKKCEIYKQYKQCYGQLSDYDRQRLTSYINEAYTEYSFNPEAWTNHTGYIFYALKVLGVVLVCFILLFGFVAYFAALPRANPPILTERQAQERQLDYMISETLRKSQSDVEDYNEDGEINCVDYACGFKWHWDKMWPEEKWRCNIVRNKNNGWHHLFVKIYGYCGEDIEVETWSKNKRYYLMRQNWDWEYDPKYNIYGETERWMKTCERRLNR